MTILEVSKKDSATIRTEEKSNAIRISIIIYRKLFESKHKFLCRVKAQVAFYHICNYNVFQYGWTDENCKSYEIFLFITAGKEIYYFS